MGSSTKRVVLGTIASSFSLATRTRVCLPCAELMRAAAAEMRKRESMDVWAREEEHPAEIDVHQPILPRMAARPKGPAMTLAPRTSSMFAELAWKRKWPVSSSGGDGCARG